MKKYPSIYISIMLITGILIYANMNFSVLAIISLVFIGIFLFVNNKYEYNVIGISFILIGISIFTLNGVKSNYNYNMDNKYYNILGDIKNINYNDGKKTVILTNVLFDSTKVQGSHVVYLNNKDENLKIGDSIRFSGKINIPKANYNPGEMSFFNYLMSKNAFSYSYTNNVKVVGYTTDNILKLQANFLNFLNETFNNLDENLSLFLYSVFSGNNILSEENNMLFSKLGIMHILSVSGFHIVILDTLIITILSLFFFNRYIKKSISIILIIYYCSLIGFPISAMRATLFLLIDSLALMLKKPRMPLKTLSITIIIILMFTPQSIFSLGFQFSFLASLAIIGVYPIIRSNYYPNKPIINNLNFIASISILLMPLQIYYFKTIPLGTFISNLIVIPLLVVIIQLGIMYILFSKFVIVDFLLTNLMNILFNFTKLVLVGIDSMFTYSFKIYLNIKEIILIYIIIFLILFLLKNYGKLKYYIKDFYILFVKLIPFHIIFIMYILNISSVTKFSMINIGQGDSFLLESKNHVILFDTGGSFKSSNSDRIISYFKYNNIKKLDGVFISHFDDDHAGNLPDILNEYKTTKIFSRVGGKDILTSKYGKIPNIDYIDLREGDNIDFDNVNLKVIYSKNDYKSENDNSLIIKINVYNNSILLTGDIEEKGENELLKKDIKSDIIKIPHHGSKTSSNINFLKKVNPKYALLSVGEKNIYNLPSSEVIKRYEDNGIQIKRTDIDGFTTIIFNKDNYKIYSYNKLFHLNILSFVNILYLLYFSYIIIIIKVYSKRKEYNEIKK